MYINIYPDIEGLSFSILNPKQNCFISNHFIFLKDKKTQGRHAPLERPRGSSAYLLSPALATYSFPRRQTTMRAVQPPDILYKLLSRSIWRSWRRKPSQRWTGQGFPGGPEGKASACHAGDVGSIPGSGRSPGEGNDYPLQDSCLENPLDEEPGGLYGNWTGGIVQEQRLS